MSGTAPRRRHGLAGLLVALFVVGGLVFSYGLGHAPPPRVCTQHAVSVPVGAVSASTGHEKPTTGATPLRGFHGPAQGVPAVSPMKVPAPVPVDGCLCVAVLFTLVLLGLAAVLRRPVSRLPARLGWMFAPPPGARLVPASSPSLQVLRL
ncbi:hypothetical protein [Actinomadura mexicana]|uniref:Uncharacterized protein n=1 Tax=Actinomadura mexicana TaxID=134959 RepID=A0A239FQS0_9ACTN|nr:hypothetical protein [Actinomadura mexicana]SNS59139.1 hypothetical protein SAMN06265355_12193 [Actinomadura mexicana]